jgi:hypothetical protein
MSVAGYLGANASGTSIPGKRERLREESAEAAKVGRLDGEPLPGGLKRAGHEDRFHASVEDYDAVLQSHCRLS